MRIKAIEVENFRGFQGSHTIEFSTEDNGVNLVIAENEVGKSTLLNAILWSLYGKLAESSKEKESIINKEYLRECKRKKSKPEANVKLSLVSKKDYNNILDPDLFEVNRTLREGDPLSGKLITYVTNGHDGNHKKISDAKEFINGFCPEGLSEYFFFDGEGIGKVIDNEERLRKSIRDLQGLDAAERALSDLNAFQKKRNDQVTKQNKRNTELISIIDDIEETTEKLKEEREQKLKKETEKNELEKKKKSKQAFIGNLGIDKVTELTTNIKNYEEQIKEFKRSLKIWEDKDKQFIGEHALAIASHKHLSKLIVFIKEKEITSSLPSGYEEVFVNGILESCECICGDKLKKNDKKWKKIESLLETAKTDKFDNAIFSIKSANQIYLKHIAQFNKNRIEIDTRLNHFDTELKKATDSLIEDKESLKNTDDKKIKKVAKEIEDIDKELFKIATVLPKIERSIKDYEAELSEDNRKRREITVGDQFLENDQAELDFIEKTIYKLEKLIEETELNGKVRIAELMNEKLQRFGRGANRFAFKENSYIPLIFDDFGKEEDTSTHDDSNSKVMTGGGGVVKQNMFFATSLTNLSRERADDETSYQIPGIICPMVADAPFSNLDASYTNMLSELLIDSSEQLIVFMYGSAYSSGFEEAINSTHNRDKLKTLHVLHRDYTSPNQGETAAEKRKKETPIMLNNKTIKTSHYDKPIETSYVVKMDIK